MRLDDMSIGDIDAGTLYFLASFIEKLWDDSTLYNSSSSIDNVVAFSSSFSASM